MELLKFMTAGSVDDGKSTFIGHLLYDVGGVYEDQLEAVKKASKMSGNSVFIDFSFITDGLSAEREQKITIDVAYRYFSTRKRKFIIADVPGHEEYTRNMITAASNSNVAILLVDVTKGFRNQSKRHLLLSSLIGVPHIIIAVNKMDAVNFSADAFEKIKNEISDFSSKLNIKDLDFIPISALFGDNVVKRSKNMSWYDGPTIISILENLHILGDRNLIDFRFPVQMILRAEASFRGYAGPVLSGTIFHDEEIIILPSGQKSRIKSVIIDRQEKEYAFSPQSVVLTLYDDVDVSRGDMIVRVHNLPMVKNCFDSIIFWMSKEPVGEKGEYFMKHTTLSTRCKIVEIIYSIDIDTLHRKSSKTIGFNEVGRARIKTSKTLMFDNYEKNRHTGSFILIDAFTNNTVGAGIII